MYYRTFSSFRSTYYFIDKGDNLILLRENKCDKLKADFELRPGKRDLDKIEKVPGSTLPYVIWNGKVAAPMKIGGANLLLRNFNKTFLLAPD